MILLTVSAIINCFVFEDLTEAPVLLDGGGIAGRLETFDVDVFAGRVNG